MQEQMPSSKYESNFASLTMIALPIIFEMNFVEVWHLHRPADSFLFREEYLELC
jgi:hypothetical protein